MSSCPYPESLTDSLTHAYAKCENRHWYYQRPMYRALAGSITQCKCQWATNPRVNPDSYHITRCLCDKHDRVSSLGNRTFRITPRVSYTHVTKLFGSHCGSLTPMFQAFHLRCLTVPFLLRPTHIIYISFYVLNGETFIGRRPKYELTTHSSTMMISDHTHAHTHDIMRCPCAYAMLMPLHVLMSHV